MARKRRCPWCSAVVRHRRYFEKDYDARGYLSGPYCSEECLAAFVIEKELKRPQGNTEPEFLSYVVEETIKALKR